MADEFDVGIAQLAGDVPVALLPVRLEARFFAAASELRVRIYPDQIHIDAHEPDLTAGERVAAIGYWQTRFARPDNVPAASDAWQTLVARFGARRAAWLVQAATPRNLARIGVDVQPRFPTLPTRPDNWSRAAYAAALPERWVVIGKRGGQELFRKQTLAVAAGLEVSPAPDDTSDVPDDGNVLQPGARWLTDFDAAEQAGMALRIDDRDLPGGQGLADGLDTLLVVGIDTTRTPAQAAASLHELFAAHAFSDGLSTVTPGTPTNLTGDAPPPANGPTALTERLDPARRAEAAAPADGGLPHLWRALGLTLSADDLLNTVDAAALREQRVAGHMTDLLWESTLGAFLTDFLKPNFSDRASLAVREHARAHLQPAGPYPALRIGKQPYGVLPVLAPGRFAAPADSFDARLAEQLARLRVLWQAAVARTPHLGRSSDLDADLTALLQMTPVSTALRYRHVLGPLALSATRGMERHAASQERITEMLGAHLRWPHRPSLSGFVAHPQNHPLRVPLVDTAPRDPGAPLSRNYLQELVELARDSGDFNAIKAREDADTLLESLAAYAIARELHRADIATIDDFRVQSGQTAERAARGALTSAEFVGIETATAATSADAVQLHTPAQAARLVIPALTGQQTVRQFVSAAIARGTPPTNNVRVLADTLAAAEFLGTCSVDELERALRGMLDAYAYRLDAWITSLASRRLAGWRQARPDGVYIGGYGWLDDLRPDTSTSPTSQGFVHAPSLPQAVTAAVLRSGHLAHHDTEHSALNLDLSSVRVRTALQLLDGIDAGQPLAALLGYRLERALRTTSLTLAQYILPLRRLAPLRPDPNAAPTASEGPSETVATRDVVDGVHLLERWRNERATLLADITPPPSASERDAIAAQLDRLADTYDAVADVLVAEAVHQNVLGNNERAGAALAALDRQERPPRIDFVRTPRSGKHYAQRLLLLFDNSTISSAIWRRLSADPFAGAEPRLNAWIARVLGSPTRIRLAATIAGSKKVLTLTVDKLGLSPLGLVMAINDSGEDARSMLERRALQVFASMLTASQRGATLTLLDTTPRRSPRTTISLGALRAVLRLLYKLITSQRAANADDLEQPALAGADSTDDSELGTRADALQSGYRDALVALDGVLVTGDAAVADGALVNALAGAAAFGIDDALHGFGDDTATLTTRGRKVSDRMHDALARAQTLRDALDEQVRIDPSLPAAQRAKVHIERMRTLLGSDFPILPLFTAGNGKRLQAGNRARSTLLGGDELAPATWLARLALVRSGVDRIAAVRHAGELIGASLPPDDLRVVQLPVVDTERWLALPFAAQPADAELAIVAIGRKALRFDRSLSGLFCDAWDELIPTREETTGIALHHDAPGARPPQAVLLAVPPAATDPQWRIDTLLETVNEARELARLRAVGPQQLQWLGTLLPAVYLPQAVSADVPGVRLTELAAKYTRTGTAVLGKE